jgi:ankyrin repeat protein
MMVACTKWLAAARDKDGGSLLHSCANPDFADLRKDDTQSWEQLLGSFVKLGLNLEEADSFSHTPLMRAVYRGKIDVASALLAIGADPHTRDRRSASVLHVAVEAGRADVLRFLLSHRTVRAIIDEADYRGQTALFYATSMPPDIEFDLGRALLEHGASAHLRSMDSRTALMMARSPGLVRLLIQHMRPQDVGAHDSSGATALHWAAYQDCVPKIEALLAHADSGLSLETADSEGYTPLHETIHYGRKQAALRLIAMGAPLHSTTSPGGSTPLHIATQRDDEDIVWALLLGGADPRARDTAGLTPLDEATDQLLAFVLEATVDRPEAVAAAVPIADCFALAGPDLAAVVMAYRFASFHPALADDVRGAREHKRKIDWSVQTRAMRRRLHANSLIY